MTLQQSRRLLAPFLAACAVLATAAPAAFAQEVEPLTLRVNDSMGLPGGLVAVVLRTYASQSVGQGQVCFKPTKKGAAPALTHSQAAAPADGGPFASFVRARVFSELSDARAKATWDEATQILDVEFRSPSGTINNVDGPLAAFYFRLADTLLPGEVYDLQLDLANSFLLGPDGSPIPIDVRAGELTIRAEAQPYEAEASAEDTIPGETAFLGLTTFEVWRLSSGQIGFQYDPAIAAGPAEVFIDPRYGNATLTVDEPAPGLIVASVTSADASLNRLPGEIVSIRLPTRADIPPGTRSAVSLDPALTFLIDRQGVELTLALEDDEIVFGD